MFVLSFNRNEKCHPKMRALLKYQQKLQGVISLFALYNVCLSALSAPTDILIKKANNVHRTAK